MSVNHYKHISVNHYEHVSVNHCEHLSVNHYKHMSANHYEHTSVYLVCLTRKKRYDITKKIDTVKKKKKCRPIPPTDQKNLI